jgi:hypothetical protein
MKNCRRLNLTKFILLRQIEGTRYRKQKYYVILPRDWDDIKFWAEQL